MGLVKKISKNHLFQWAVVVLIYGYTVLVHLTSRWRGYGYAAIEPLVHANRPLIIAMWHGRILLAPKFPLRPRKHYAIVSLHGDGAYVAKYMRCHHIHTVRGSSRKGAISAFKEALRVLKQGHLLVITPDGPRGPGMKVGGNIMALAKMTGALIIPYAQSTNKCRFLRTWDRFCIPFLFGKGVYMYGEPIGVSSSATETELEEARVNLEKRLNQVTKECDRLAGITSIIP